MIRVALRFDDPSVLSDHELEEHILAAARQAAIPLSIAVIPYRRIEGKLQALRPEHATHLIAAQNEGLIEVAQHGYCHESQRAEDKSPPSEFMGVEADRQDRFIREGRQVLEDVFGHAPKGFVPPWNTFDDVTTEILSQAGFQYLSAGWEQAAGSAGDVTYLPRTCQMVDVVEIIQKLKPFVRLSPVVIGVMHHYDFAESGNSGAVTDLTSFQSLLSKLAQTSWIRPVTLAQLTHDEIGSCAKRRRQNAWAKLPWRLRTQLPQDALFRQTWPHLLLHSFLSRL